MQEPEKPVSDDPRQAPPSLLETLLWEPERGFFLLDLHQKRIAASAAALGYRFDAAAFQAAVEPPSIVVAGGRPRRARVTATREGVVRCEWGEALESRPLRCAWALEPVSSTDARLGHKTTARALYDAARAARPEVDEVILWNERGEATETSTGNLVVEIGGERITPSRDAGLLPGTFRAHLLATGQLREGRIRRDDVERADALFHINSVRRWCPMVLVPSAGAPAV
jgi:para-aminobenzoate synthetase/4-amino-4-deoxychorismate lyase